MTLKKRWGLPFLWSSSGVRARLSALGFIWYSILAFGSSRSTCGKGGNSGLVVVHTAPVVLLVLEV